MLTKAVEAPAALSKALSAEDVDATCGPSAVAVTRRRRMRRVAVAASCLMSGIKSMSSAAADGVTTGVASGLQAVFGEDIDRAWRRRLRKSGGVTRQSMGRSMPLR